MAKTVNKLATLPHKIAEYQKKQTIIREKATYEKHNYESKLSSFKKETQEKFDKFYNSFKWRPHLTVFLIGALLLNKFVGPSILLFWMSAASAIAILISSIKPLGFNIYWAYKKQKVKYPYTKMRQYRNEIARLKEETRKHTQGLKGEQFAAMYLNEKLPDSYYIYNDVTLPYGDKRVQIDHVLVGPAGVFTVETKNITGNYFYDSAGWLRLPAHTIKGIPVKNYNRKVIACPQDQAKAEAEALESYLNRNGLNEKVRPMLLLTNSECQWNGGPKDTNVPVYFAANMVSYILSLPQRRCSPDRASMIIAKLQRA